MEYSGRCRDRLAKLMFNKKRFKNKKSALECGFFLFDVFRKLRTKNERLPTNLILNFRKVLESF
jgi:hypothetical protein